jgi:hypothetical protein
MTVISISEKVADQTASSDKARLPAQIKPCLPELRHRKYGPGTVLSRSVTTKGNELLIVQFADDDSKRRIPCLSPQWENTELEIRQAFDTAPARQKRRAERLLGEKILGPPLEPKPIPNEAWLCRRCDSITDRLVDIDRCDYRGCLLAREKVCPKCCIDLNIPLPTAPRTIVNGREILGEPWKCVHGVYQPSGQYPNLACSCCRYEVFNICMQCTKPNVDLMKFKDKDLFLSSDQARKRKINIEIELSVCLECHTHLSQIQEYVKRIHSIIGKLDLRRVNKSDDSLLGYTEFGRMYTAADVARECIAKMLTSEYLGKLKLENPGGIHNYLRRLCETTALDMSKREDSNHRELRHYILNDDAGNPVTSEILAVDNGEQITYARSPMVRSRKDGTLEIAVLRACLDLRRVFTIQERSIFQRIFFGIESGREISKTEKYLTGEHVGSLISKTQVYAIYNEVLSYVAAELYDRAIFINHKFVRVSKKKAQGGPTKRVETVEIQRLRIPWHPVPTVRHRHTELKIPNRQTAENRRYLLSPAQTLRVAAKYTNPLACVREYGRACELHALPVKPLCHCILCRCARTAGNFRGICVSGNTAISHIETFNSYAGADIESITQVLDSLRGDAE